MALGGAMPLTLFMSPLGWLYYFPAIWISVAAIFVATRRLATRQRWPIAATGSLVFSGLTVHDYRGS